MSSSLGYQLKDPADTRIYGVDWSSFLGSRGTGTKITASTFLVAAGLTKLGETFTDTTASVEVADGTDSTDVLISNTVTLSNGEIVRKSFTVRVRFQ